MSVRISDSYVAAVAAPQKGKEREEAPQKGREKDGAPQKGGKKRCHSSEGQGTGKQISQKSGTLFWRDKFGKIREGKHKEEKRRSDDMVDLRTVHMTVPIAVSIKVSEKSPKIKKRSAL